MAPKKPARVPSQRPRRPSRATKTTQSASVSQPAALAPQPIPQEPPVATVVPRPTIWEPIDLSNKSGWLVNNPKYFDEVHERLAALFSRRPKGWKSQKGGTGSGGSGKLPRKQTPEDVAKTHANYTRLQVHKVKFDGTTWSKKADFDDTWQAERLVGAGSFGRVGLWVKRDGNSNIVDEMAIKEEDYEVTSAWEVRGVAEEAINNEFMNKDSVENFQRLRGFTSTTTPADNPVLKYQGQDIDRRWRYYFEYAPHGSLERLIRRYRAWNQYLPESFLWHVFDSLAQVLVSFDETKPNPKAYSKGLVRAVDRMVHFDIKPDNIYLGYEQPFDSTQQNYGGHQSNVYPMIKIGDFGVAALTSTRDPQNPAGRFWGRGTPYYMPPEQMHYGAAFPTPPNGLFVPLQNEMGDFIAKETRESQTNPAKINFTQPMNVWSIGKVMYDLATLSHNHDYAGLSTQDYAEYKQWNENAIADFQTIPFTATNNAKDKQDPAPCPYSKDLMDLIEQCMKPVAKSRIKAQVVKTTTAKNLARYGNDDGLAMNEKVYFNGNEINNMPQGVEDFTYFDGPKESNPCRKGSKTDLIDVMDYTVDPNEPELQPPRWAKKLAEYKTKQKQAGREPYNLYWQQNCQIVNGKVIFSQKPGVVSADGGAPAVQDDGAATGNVASTTATNNTPTTNKDSNKGGKVKTNATGPGTGACIKKNVPPKSLIVKFILRTNAAQNLAAAAVAAAVNPTTTTTQPILPTAPAVASQAQPAVPAGGRQRHPRKVKGDANTGRYRV